MSDLISRKAVIDRINKQREHLQPDIYPQDAIGDAAYRICAEFIERLPAAQPEKEISKRVLWSGWKGDRYTRYWCPNCGKPVRNDDDYCHRCGQKIMFPQISFSKYVPGETQQTIVTWEDENGSD